MNCDEIAKKMCELLTARQVFMVYTRYQQYLVVGTTTTFDVTVGGLVATFTKATTKVDINDGWVYFDDGNAHFGLKSEDVLAIDRF